MSVNLTINNTVYPFPEEGDVEWGTQVTDWATAVSNGMLQKAGGAFTLLADINFGATYGLTSAYYKTRGTNIADAGQFRLANLETIQWRNAANSANLALTVNASNELQYNGSTLISGLAVTDTATIDLTLTGANISADVKNDSITNAMINASAAIAYSKLNLATSILNADINASAAIAYSKLAALTASRALVSDGSGVVSVSAVTSTELGFVAGVTSGIQTQIDSKAPSASAVTLTGVQTLTNKTLTSPVINTPTGIVKGDVGLGNVDNTSDATKNAASVTLTNKTINGADNTLTVRAANDITGQLPIANGGTGAASKAAGFDALSPMTTSGDIIYGGASGTGTRLPKGSDTQVLTLTAGLPTWASPAAAPATLAIVSKVANYTATTADDLILCSGATFTITLYATSGNSGKQIRIMKTDATLANIITIDGNASETINGALTTTLNTQYESVTLVCDGSNWNILDRQFPKTITTIGATALTATGTALAKGTTVTDTSFWYREGRNLVYTTQMHFSAAGTTGTGEYRITLPSSLAADTAVIPALGTTLGTGGSALANAKSHLETSGGWISQSTSRGDVQAFLTSSTTVGFIVYNSVSDIQPWGAGAYGLGGGGTAFGVTFKIPISGWNA